MNQARKIFEAIKKINSDAEFIIKDATIESVEWHNGTTPISKADIEAKMVEVQAEYDANQYQEIEQLLILQFKNN